ncbi:MAG: ATP-binding protein, partial [Lachnospiraceae bacterium]|nr:ATP-binding protein [Lachnospiraceae bacterium]
MEIPTLKKLLQDGEGLTVEFKKNSQQLNNSVFETISSFSNRYGGHIFLGVDDDGTILGVQPAAVHGMKMNFANLLNNPLKVSPSMYLTLEEIRIDDKVILHTYVPEGS